MLDEEVGPYRRRAQLYYGQGLMLNLVWCPKRRQAFFWISDCLSSCYWDPNDVPAATATTRWFGYDEGVDLLKDLAGRRGDDDFHHRVGELTAPAIESAQGVNTTDGPSPAT